MFRLDKFAILLLVFSTASWSYEVSTHAALTREAYKKSALQAGDLLTRLGVSSIVDDLGNVNLGNIYFDVDPSGTVTARLNNYGNGGNTGDVGFTEDKFKDANKRLSDAGLSTPVFQSPAGWLMVGSIREDDVIYDPGAPENPPQDDPAGNINRVLNHFYDPYRDIPLTVALAFGSRTPDWAIDGTDKNGQHRNHFSIMDAKEAMFRAATLRKLNNGQLEKLPSPVVPSSMSSSGLSDVEQMAAYWATVFRSLGDAAHLLEDMAQPQHTRNDKHAGMFCGQDSCYGGYQSFYEKYLEARVKNVKTFTLTKQFIIGNENEVSPPIEPQVLTYDGYDVPRFNNYYDYYRSEGKTGGDSYYGTGLANYSNKGFFSAGTNLGSSSLPSPSNDKDAFYSKVLEPTEVKGMNGMPVEGNNAKLTLLQDNVTDNLKPRNPDTFVSLTSYGVLDQFLRNKGKDPIYTLNHYNYDAQADLLLPRAVSYSAGLIDYFFRGNMEIRLPKAGVYGIVDHAQFKDTDPIKGFKGFGKIKLKLKNVTKDVITAENDQHPQTMRDGILVAVLKFYRNIKYTDNLDGELSGDASGYDYLDYMSDEPEMVVSDPIPLSRLAYNEETELTFNFPEELPINAWLPRLTVVFRGKLGDEEDAVIVSGKPLSSPIYYAMENDTDYVHLANKKCYTRGQIIADDALWGMLASRCKKSLDPLAPREFSADCTERAMNAEIDFGGNDSDLYSEWYDPNGALPVRRFGRVAFLTDNEGTDVTTYTWAYGKTVSDNDSFKGLAWIYFTFDKERGVNAFGWSGLVTNGNDNLSDDACTAGFLTKDDPTDLQDEERIPMPTTSISGWDDP